jgi:hypothetical protein
METGSLAKGSVGLGARWDAERGQMLAWRRVIKRAGDIEGEGGW